MDTHADKTEENKSQSVSAPDSQIQSGEKSTFQFVDNRPEAVAQRKLQEMANNSRQVSQLMAFQEMANNSPQVKQAAQLQVMANNYSAQHQQPIQRKENNTGLPDNLKTGMENLSGISLDDVKVHRNSDKPAQLQAHAYAQGTDIHLGAGQEKHLPHEAWHVVQQKQGRVKPTMQMKGKVNVNDDAGLEKEADVMGAKALSLAPTSTEDSSLLIKERTIQNSLVQRRAFIGESYKAADAQQGNDEQARLINDVHSRRFKNQGEFEGFAKGERLGVAGELENGTWIRVDQFTILGEDHGARKAPEIIRALGTNRFRYEGFVHVSNTRKSKDERLNTHLEERDTERNELFGLGNEQEGQTHEAEHVLPKYARIIPDLKSVANDQKTGQGSNYVAANTDFAGGYGMAKTLIKGFLDALIYAKSYENKFLSHTLKTFYKEYKVDIDASILGLSAIGNLMPDLARIPAVSNDVTFNAMKEAYKVAAMKKEGMNDKKLNAFKGTLTPGVKEQGITPEANEMDYLRDHSLLETINKAKSKDLLFIMGDAHREKLQNKVGSIPIMRDATFIEGEKKKNKQAKYEMKQDQDVKGLENQAKAFAERLLRPYKSRSFKHGDKVSLESLKKYGAAWQIGGIYYHEAAEVVIDYESLDLKVWLVPPTVKEPLVVSSSKIYVSPKPKTP
jgi:hypothetical protein